MIGVRETNEPMGAAGRAAGMGVGAGAPTGSANGWPTPEVNLDNLEKVVEADGSISYVQKTKITCQTNCDKPESCLVNVGVLCKSEDGCTAEGWKSAKLDLFDLFTLERDIACNFAALYNHINCITSWMNNINSKGMLAKPGTAYLPVLSTDNPFVCSIGAPGLGIPSTTSVAGGVGDMTSLPTFQADNLSADWVGRCFENGGSCPSTFSNNMAGAKGGPGEFNFA